MVKPALRCLPSPKSRMLMASVHRAASARHGTGQVRSSDSSQNRGQAVATHTHATAGCGQRLPPRLTGVTIPDECPSLQLLWPPRKPRFQVVSKGFSHREYLQGRGLTLLPAHHSPSEHWEGRQQPPFPLTGSGPTVPATGPGEGTDQGWGQEGASS